MSARFSLNSIDLKKIGKGLLIAIAGAGFTYLEQQVFPTIDFGVYTPMAVALNSVIVNIVNKRLSGPAK